MRRNTKWVVKYLIGVLVGFLIPKPWSYNQRLFMYSHENVTIPTPTEAPLLHDSNDRRHTVLKDEFETLDKRDLLLIGIMTNNQFIHERGCAIKNTWGKHFRDIVFYLEETPLARQPDCDIGTVVHLKGVSNVYPPQKKSFMMFRHMASHYGDRYKWFLRADDDAYVNVDNLRTFLSSIRSIDDNGSHVFHYIGQVIWMMFSCCKS